MTPDLAPIARAARLARSRVRGRAVAAAVARVGAPAAVVAAGLALSLEVARGLTGSVLPLVLLPLVAPVVAGARAAACPVGDGQALKALDDAAGLDDRLGTALAFDGAEGGLIGRQRADALDRASGVEPRLALPVAGAARIRPVLLALAGLLAVLGVCLSLDLTPEAGSGARPSPLEDAADDLLARLDALEAAQPEGVRKEIASALTDLRAQVERIRDRERRSRANRPEASREQEREKPAAAVEATREEVPREQAITAEQLSALHDRLQRDLAAAFDMDAEKVRRAVADAVNGSGSAAQRAEKSFSAMQAREIAQRPQAMASPTPGTQGSRAIFGGRQGIGVGGQQAMAGGAGFAPPPPGQGPAGLDPNSALAQAQGRETPPASVRGDPTQTATRAQERANQMIDQIKQEYTKEKDQFEGHEQQHNLHESFQQFLEQYTFNRSQQLADFLGGKPEGKKKGPQPKLNPPPDALGKPMADRKISGFEEKKGEGATSMESKDAIDGGSSEAMREGKDTAPMPGDKLAEANGPPQAAAPGAASAQGQGTAKGGAGAGRGDGSEGGEPETHALQGAGGESEIERVLGRGAVRDGGLTPEERRRVFDRVATVKVQGGLNTGGDEPVLGGYFEEADRLLDEASEELPPLFRDYARGYFAALSGGGGGGETQPPRASPASKAPQSP